MNKIAERLKERVLSLERDDKDFILNALIADSRAEDFSDEDIVTFEPILESRTAGRFLLVEDSEAHINERHQRILARLNGLHA